MIYTNRDGSYPLINQEPHIITDEFNESRREFIKDIESLHTKGLLKVLWLKYRLSEYEADNGQVIVNVIPVSRWAIFELNEISGEWVLKLIWQTDDGKYVPLQGSRFQNTLNSRVQRRGTLKEHLIYQMVSKYRNIKDIRRNRRDKSENYIQRVLAQRRDYGDYMGRENRRTLAQAVSELTGGGGSPLIPVTKQI